MGTPPVRLVAALTDRYRLERELGQATRFDVSPGGDRLLVFRETRVGRTDPCVLQGRRTQLTRQIP